MLAPVFDTTIKIKGLIMKVTLKYSGLAPISITNSAGGIYTIKPTVSEVSAEAWKILKEQSDVKKMLEMGEKDETWFDPKTGRGALVVVSDLKESASPEKAEKQGEKVPGRNQGESKALVAETEDTSLLNKWLDGETRAGVKNSIEKKLKQIEDYRAEHGEKE